MLSTPIRFVWVAPGWKWRKLNFLTCREGKKKSYNAAKKLTVGLGEEQCHLKNKTTPWYPSSWLWGRLALIHIEIMNGFLQVRCVETLSESCQNRHSSRLHTTGLQTAQFLTPPTGCWKLAGRKALSQLFFFFPLPEHEFAFHKQHSCWGKSVYSLGQLLCGLNNKKRRLVLVNVTEKIRQPVPAHPNHTAFQSYI